MTSLLPKEEVALIKQDLWDGVTQKEVAAKHGISQPTISRIISGLAHYNVAWPDGGYGPMKQARRRELRKGKIQKKLSLTERIREANKLSTGKVSKEIKIEVAQALMDSTTEEGGEADTSPPVRQGQRSKHKTQGSRQVASPQSIEEFFARADEKAEAALEQDFVEGLSKTGKGQKKKIKTPAGYIVDAVPWEHLEENYSLNPLVKVAIEEEDENLKNAIATVFRVLPESSWEDPDTAHLVLQTKQMLMEMKDDT